MRTAPILTACLFVSSLPAFALQYKVDPAGAELWALREAPEDTWELLWKECEPVLKPDSLPEEEGPLPEEVGLHELLRAGLAKSLEEERDVPEGPFDAPNCPSAVLALFDPDWKPEPIEWEEAEARLREL